MEWIADTFSVGALGADENTGAQPMQAYSDPTRANDPHAMPDLEVFYHEHAKRELCALNAGCKAELYGECIVDDEGDCGGSGWYWWACFPGCLPDSEPSGPFPTESEALADARNEMEG